MDGDVKEYNYISGPNGLIAVYIVMNGTGTLYYTVTDHTSAELSMYLGSIVQLIDANGTVIEQTNYVQDPTNPQNYNRYAYCMNNPLKYTDQTGELYDHDSRYGGYNIMSRMSEFIYDFEGKFLGTDGMRIDDYFTASGKYLGPDGDKNSHDIRIVDEETYNNLLGKNNSEGKPLLQTSGDAKLWNDSEMSPEVRLAVYDHYNETGLKLIVKENLKEGALMAYTTLVAILIPVQRNTQSESMNNYYNVSSCLDHERGHYNDHVSFGDAFSDIPVSWREVRAILYQMKQDNWDPTTGDFKRTMSRYMDSNFNMMINGE